MNGELEKYIVAMQAEQAAADASAWRWLKWVGLASFLLGLTLGFH